MANRPTPHPFVPGYRIGTRDVIEVVKHPSGQFCRMRCDCGKEAQVRVYDLLKNPNAPCAACKIKNLRKSHGDTYSPEHRAWKAMHTRCYNPKFKNYKDYGGKGIIVCDRWRGDNGYTNFLSDMGRKPDDADSIDRIDTNGNYEPGNCRWTTWTVQARNKTTNHLLTVGGETKTVAEWSEIHDMPEATIRRRVGIQGMTAEEALTAPLDPRGRPRT